MPFTKSEGCNKMPCTCGHITCYICSANITKEKYAHFCQTPHCNHKKCAKCPLWTTEAQDDERVKKMGEELRKELAQRSDVEDTLKAGKFAQKLLQNF